MHLSRSSVATLALASLLALGACATDPTAPGDAHQAPKEITTLPRALTGAERDVIAANNTFAFGLLRELNRAQRGENLFTSPLSMSMALGMLANGTGGATYDELRATLGFEPSRSRDEINQSYRALIDMLRALDPLVDFRIANSIWLDTGFPIEPSFLATSKQYFDARAETLDFRSPAALGTINGWVAQSTNGKIEKMLESIDPAEVMFLMNAIYFKGDWRTQFAKGKTRDDLFNPLVGAQIPVRMMERTGATRTAAFADYEAIELPYGGNAYAMTILLPTAGKSVNDLAESLTAEQWDTIVARLATESAAIVQMPKFKVEWKATLNEQLEALGMRRAFSGGADFTSLSPLGNGKLYVTRVDHKTYVDVNEEGTEAAAVTSVGVGIVCACWPRTIRIDRPFVFAIRERLSGTILFMGKIVRP